MMNLCFPTVVEDSDNEEQEPSTEPLLSRVIFKKK